MPITQLNALQHFCSVRKNNGDRKAGVIADMIAAGRQVDAVFIPPEYETAIKSSPGVSPAYFLRISGTLTMLYPGEEREKYLQRREAVLYGKQYVYHPLSYGKAASAADILKKKKIPYEIRNDAYGSGPMTFSLSVGERFAKEAEMAVKLADKEDELSKYLKWQNLCAASLSETIDKAIHSEKDVFLLSESGERAIHIAPKEAAIICPPQPVQTIKRDSESFKKDLTMAAVRVLMADKSIVKTLSGKETEIFTDGENKLTAAEAMKALGLTAFPSGARLLELRKQDTEGKYKKEISVLMRMRAARNIQLDDEIKEKRPGKEERAAYQKLHQESVRAFMETEFIQDTGRGTEEEREEKENQGQERQRLEEEILRSMTHD